MAASRRPIVPEGVGPGGTAADPGRPAEKSPGTETRPNDEAKSVAREVKQGAREARSKVEHEAKDAVEKVKDRAGHEVEEQKERASGKAHAIARALREAGAALEREGESALARYGREGADQIERVASYLDGNDFGGLVSDLEGTARRNPGAFVGGSFAAGMLLGRFLRASTPQADTATAATETYSGTETLGGSGTYRGGGTFRDTETYRETETHRDDDMPGTIPLTTTPAAPTDGPITSGTTRRSGIDTPSRTTQSDAAGSGYAASSRAPESQSQLPSRSLDDDTEVRNG